MDIELDPPHGITGFPLGMPAADLKAAAAALGEVRVTKEGQSGEFNYMKVLVLHPQFEIVFHLEDGSTLGAAEVWIPGPGPEEVNVHFRGTDVFRTPALELLDHVRGLGYEVQDPEELYPKVRNLTLGFTRTAGHEVPLAPDKLPLYFQAVLVGPAAYYDYDVEG